MQVTVILTMLSALVHATTAEGVPVEIELGKEKDTPKLKRTFDTVDIGCMEVFNFLDEKKSEQDTELLKVPLEKICDEDMLARLEKYWDSDMTDSDEDIDADTFYNFIRAVDFLLLQGDKYKQFARNMVRKGLLGKHSMAIVRQPLDEYYMGCLQRIACQMLIALASECGCEVRVLKHDGRKADVTLCSVDDGEAESYGVPGSVFETSPVIGRLSVRCNILSDKVDRMEILTWLTDHLEVTLLWIGYEFGMTKKDTQSIMKWDEETTHTRLGLSLDFSGYKQSSYSFVEALIPTIPTLKELHIRGAAFEPSAAHTFGQCVGLEKLCIDGSRQTSSFVSALMPNLLNIRELRILVEELSPDAAEAFEKCVGLEKLFLDGSWQSSSFVSALMPSLPKLRELRITVKELSPDAAAFRQCKELEKLCLDGSWQSSSFVSALMPSLPNIRELTIRVGMLSRDAAAAFRQCKGLEKLDLYGYDQTSSFVSALMPSLPNIRELEICIKELSPGAAAAFEKCVGLEKLCLTGSEQSSSFISVLMANLPNIRELWIYARELSPGAAAAFRQCKELKMLYLIGYEQSSSFVSTLMPSLPNIRELRIEVDELSRDAAEAFRECKELKMLYLIGFEQSSSFVEVLMPSLPNIRELRIDVGELSPGASMAFRQCKRLEELVLDSSLAPGCIERILSSPHMESLRYLEVHEVIGGPSDGDERAMDEAKERHVVVIILNE